MISKLNLAHNPTYFHAYSQQFILLKPIHFTHFLIDTHFHKTIMNFIPITCETGKRGRADRRLQQGRETTGTLFAPSPNE